MSGNFPGPSLTFCALMLACPAQGHAEAFSQHEPALHDTVCGRCLVGSIWLFQGRRGSGFVQRAAWPRHLLQDRGVAWPRSSGTQPHYILRPNYLATLVAAVLLPFRSFSEATSCIRMNYH
eukprot:6208564-Pleurochrysis_carterae.AAC.9